MEKTHSHLSHLQKGQMVSTELVICSSIFMLALLIFIFTWNAITANYYEEQANRDMEVALIGISDMAVLSPGYPNDWETSTGFGASAFGFAQSRNVLSSAKLSALSSLNSNYAEAKERMGAGRFDVFIGVVGNPAYNFGREAGYQNDSLVSVSAERLCILEGEPVLLRVQVWRQKGVAQQ